MTITILQINDTHGYLEPHPELFWSGSTPRHTICGGYAKIRTVFEQVRRENPGGVLALDNGDTIHGTYQAVQSKGVDFIEPLNLLQLDGWTGHWDFAYGVEQLRAVAKQLHHPFLAINCYEKDTNRLAFPPTRVVERNGVRIGIIGIAAVIVDKTMPPHFGAGLRFTLGNEELPGHVERLRTMEKVQLVVVVSHLGFPQDVKLAHEVSGIDVLLSGHTHNRMERPLKVNGAILIQSGCHASFVGRLDLDLVNGEIRGCKHQLITLDEAIPEDMEMKEVVRKIVAKDSTELARMVGSTAVDLNRNTFLEATMDNLLLQAVAHAAGLAISFSNGWRYGAPIPKGPIRMNDLWNIIPSNPPISTVTMSGEEIRRMLEENLENSVAADPYRQMGGFLKRCYGLEILIKLENPKGSRVQRISRQGEDLDPSREYQIAFVTTQGVPAHYGRNRVNLNLHAIAALEKFIADRPDFDAGLKSSILAI